jgi:cytochrome c553
MDRFLLTALIAASIGFVGTAHAAGDAAAGKAKATACAMCHGPAGLGTQVGPKIAGLDQAVFVQALKDYASGKKVNPLMKAQASALSDADEANLAAYFATLK